MRRRRPTPLRLLAAFLALLSLPGWAEVLENVEHLLHDGHLAHSAEHVAMAPDDHDLGSHQEAGCTAIAHHCGCCLSIAAQCPSVVESVFTEPEALPTSPAPFYRGRASNLALAPPLRPPIA